MRITVEQTVGGRPVHKAMHHSSREALETTIRNVMLNYIYSDEYRADPERSAIFIHVQEW